MNSSKLKYIVIISVLLLINIYSLWLVINVKIENVRLKKINNNGLLEKQKKDAYENNIVINKLLMDQKLNLIALWGENGCNTCKQKLANEYKKYKNLYAESFKFVYVGNHLRDIKAYNVEDYLTFTTPSADKLFEKPLEIMQPIILLTNNKGNILFLHEIILGDTLEFQKFNDKCQVMFSVVKE
ncbi:MAG: hypothetical protein GXX85_07000 [Ignavibacteria bacterium]|nr:hypothetical protein [Ignavibacteria bacterium]